MKKRIYRICVLLCGLFFFSSPPGQTQTITVVTEEYPPYNFTENGVIKGCSTEIVQEVLKRAGIPYSLTSYPWARTYNTALNTPNVLIYSIGRSEKREKLFKWIDVVAPYDIHLYKLKKRTDLTVTGLDDAKKYRIGAVRDDVRAQFLEKNGFEQVLHLPDLSAGLFLAFSLKTDDSLVEKCRAALAEIKKDGTYDAIMQKFLQ